MASQICHPSLCSGLGDTNSRRNAHGTGPMDDTGLCLAWDQPQAISLQACFPYSGCFIKSLSLASTSAGHIHCPGCLMLPASWHRAWVPCLRGWSRLSGPLFQPSCVCPLCASANGSRGMFAVSTPAGAEGMRPYPPAAQVPWVQPLPGWLGLVGKRAAPHL